jgi:sialidase-1
LLGKIAYLTLAAAVCMNAATPVLEKVELWEEGEDGYKLYRIPGLVTTAKGSVLAYAEARRYSGSDWDTIDIVMRRSTDGGRTFSRPKVIARVPGDPERSAVAIERKLGRPDDVTYNNPVAVADRDGSIHFLFCLEYMRVFYMRSDDDGNTFSQPAEITSVVDAFRPEYAWRVIATGPGHGIQLRNGRLIVPIWLSLGTGTNGHSPSVTSTVYSDNHGINWHSGAIAVQNTPQFPNPNEATVAQRTDGSVLLNVRTGAKQNRRTVVTSKDGATAWTAPHLQSDLPDPICFASVIRFSTKKTNGRARLLFSNPDNLTRVDGREIVSKDRKNLTVYLSYNEGKSWTAKRSLEPGSSSYSDMSVLPDGSILCLYETVGTKDGLPKQKLVLARFNLEWLTAGKDSLRRRSQ